MNHATNRPTAQRSRYALPALIAALLLLTACAGPATDRDNGLHWRRVLFTRLQDRLSLPLIERAQVMPDYLLKSLRDYDHSLGIVGTERYLPRAPTPAERAMLSRYLTLLPPAHRRVMRHKLLGIYLVDHFSGAGLTDWVIDPANHSYYYLVLNSAVLTTSLDAWLTYKANSYFQPAPRLPALRVTSHTRFTALMYALLHEGAHMVDYDLGITPYVERQQRALVASIPPSTPFTKGVWTAQDQPIAAYDIPQRKNLNIYALFPAKQALPRHTIPTLFEYLRNSPFVSLYSTTSWNEDLADYLTDYHLQTKLGGRVQLELLDKDGSSRRFAPLDATRQSARAAAIQVFYR